MSRFAELGEKELELCPRLSRLSDVSAPSMQLCSTAAALKRSSLWHVLGDVRVWVRLENHKRRNLGNLTAPVLPST